MSLSSQPSYGQDASACLRIIRVGETAGGGEDCGKLMLQAKGRAEIKISEFPCLPMFKEKQAMNDLPEI